MLSSYAGPCINDDDCSLQDHLWLMPFETLSLLQLHLLRNRRHYPRQYQTVIRLKSLSHGTTKNSFGTDSKFSWHRILSYARLVPWWYRIKRSGRLQEKQMVTHNGLPQLSKRVGRSMLNSGKPGDGNFTMESPNKSWWSLKDRAMQKHLSKNTVSLRFSLMFLTVCPRDLGYLRR